MSLLLDAAGHPPLLPLHHHLLPPFHLAASPPPWPCPNALSACPAPPLSPSPMSSPDLHPYLAHLPDTPLAEHHLAALATSSWYRPSVSAPDCAPQPAYAAYAPYAPSQPVSTALSPPTSTYPFPANPSVSTARTDTSALAMSPRSTPAQDPVLPASSQPSEELQANQPRSHDQPSARWRPTPHLMDRPHSSSGNLHSATVDASWAMNPLGIQNTPIHHDHFYPAYPTTNRSPRLSEPLMELPSSHISSPQPRRYYTTIAPQPMEAPRSSRAKRARDDEDDVTDDVKRRKRSESNTSIQFELGEEDRLLLQLKEEESMPWKDIAARFQSDLGKSYHIPALQMRLKRLRERMRVWTETDVKALRMAHEYWAQNKFDIISQKMLDFGAQEKWTSRQCARKWAEIDPAPTPYAHFESHLQHGFAPYSMSPAEAPNPFLSYMNVQ